MNINKIFLILSLCMLGNSVQAMHYRPIVTVIAGIGCLGVSAYCASQGYSRNVFITGLGTTNITRNTKVSLAISEPAILTFLLGAYLIKKGIN